MAAGDGMNMAALWGYAIFSSLLLPVAKIVLKKIKMPVTVGICDVFLFIIFLLCLFYMWKNDTMTIITKSIYTFVGVVGYGGNLGLYIAEKIEEKDGVRP